MPTITVDRDVCMGTGVCMAYAPTTLEHDDDGIATVLPASEDSPAAMAAAVDSCPVRALSLTTSDQES